MRKQLARTLLVAGTAAVAMSLAVPAAMAVVTCTVTGGPNFTATAKAGTTVTVKDTVTGSTLTCTAAAAAGTVVDQNMSPNTVIGHVTSSTFGNAAKKCNGPLGSTATSTHQTGPAPIIFVGYNPATDIAALSITGVDQLLTISSVLGACAGEVKGMAGVTYNNGNQLLQFTTAGDNLEVTSTAGPCAGIIATGDVVTITSGASGETVTGAPVNPITIRQP